MVAALERAADPDSGHTHPEYYEAIETVEADGNTVVLTLSAPTSSLLYNLARPDSIIYQAGTVGDAAQPARRDRPLQVFADVGAGEQRTVGEIPELLTARPPTWTL